MDVASRVLSGIRTSVARVLVLLHAAAAAARRRLPAPGSARFRVLVAGLIGLAAAVGSIAAWRAEEAARGADTADRTGIGDRVAEQRERARISADLQNIFFDYLHAQAARERAEALAGEAETAPEGERERLLVQASAEEAFARARLDRIDADAFRNGRNSRLDLQRKFQIEFRLAAQQVDLDPRPEFAAADRERTKSEHLVGLTSLLIAAALFLTLAQVARRGPTLLYLGCGVVVLLTAVSLLLTLEVAS